MVRSKLSALTFASSQILIFVFCNACATYHGPGDLKTASDDIGSEEYQQIPSTNGGVSWRGARKTTRPQSEVNFDWPVDSARLTQGFHLGRKPHWGIDLAASKGTSILASEAGTVIYTGHGFHGYGNLIVIEHGSEWATLYSHLDKIEIKEGDTVKQGQRLGSMGRTGRATGVHLHFEIRQNRQPVNPLAYMPGGLGPIVPGPQGGQE